MACHAIERWSFSSLVGAYLDLALAYLLLFGSTLAFFAAKFLQLFGLHLPCSCCNGGFFSHPTATCLQTLLVDGPIDRIVSVQMSIRRRFPFDSILNDQDRTCRVDVRFLKDDEAARGGGFLEMAGEESCGYVSNQAGPAPVSEPEMVRLELGSSSSARDRDGVQNGKGKGILLGQRLPPSGLRRRRRAAVVDRGKTKSFVSSSPSQTPFRGSEMQHAIYEESSAPADCGGAGHRLPEDGISFVEETTSEIRLDGPLFKFDSVGMESSSGARVVHVSDGNEANTIKILEQALEEEQAVRAALYVELEKERSAAASAADEAMAMILRLQKEKAAIEMEARQYQRMIEEKSSYDEEEMEILKEIIVRREKEKHVLEKEVEVYRQMMLSGEWIEQQSHGDLHDVVYMMGLKPGSSSESPDDPVLMLQQISESIEKKEKANNNKEGSDIADKQNCTGTGTEPLSLGLAGDASYSRAGELTNPHIIENHRDYGDEYNVEFQEKGMVSMDIYPSSAEEQRCSYRDDSILYKLDGSQGRGFYKESSHLVDDVDGEKDGKTEIRVSSDDLSRESGQDAGQRGSDFSQFETESSVHDVHVIDDKRKFSEEVSGKEINLSWKGCTSYISMKGGTTVESSSTRNIDHSSNHSSARFGEVEQNVHRSFSDMTNGWLSTLRSSDKASLIDLRRSSMSEVDYERFKLETEVENLRERLKVVQQGREKLSFSVEHREREIFQLQLLEEIACQLREIRKLTEPGKAVRQASLPPPSSKVNSKKRRCRSVSWGIHGRT